MVRAIINGAPVEAPEGATILAAARAAGFRIPTLCTMEGLSDIGACRVCVVEVEGRERLAAGGNGGAHRHAARARGASRERGAAALPA